MERRAEQDPEARLYTRFLAGPVLTGAVCVGPWPLPLTSARAGWHPLLAEPSQL